jgi:4-hydroxy-2-oxoheptanedioate aldolase
MERKPFKDRLHGGEPMCCMTVMLGEPTIVETCAAGGIDFLFVCSEHGTRSPDRLDAVARTALALGIPAIARVPYPDGREVSRLIEMGYVGTILPHTRSVEQVKDFVAAHFHPPQGYRSFANCVRTGDWGLIEGNQYIQASDGQLVVAVMIEDVEAVENADLLLAVPGVDIAFIGRADLSLSMHGRYAASDPSVLDATAHVTELCRHHNVAPMTYIDTAEQVKLFRDMGVQLLVLGGDMGLWAVGCRDAARLFRSVYGLS